MFHFTWTSCIIPLKLVKFDEDVVTSVPLNVIGSDFDTTSGACLTGLNLCCPPRYNTSGSNGSVEDIVFLKYSVPFNFT